MRISTLAIARNVKARDSFWIKGLRYSLVDLFGAGFPDSFIGGLYIKDI